MPTTKQPYTYPSDGYLDVAARITATLNPRTLDPQTGKGQNYNGNFTDPPIRDVEEAHKFWIENDVLPGLAFFKGGERKFKLRRDQEKWTFSVRNYFEGYVVPQWTVTLQIWSYEQLAEANRLFLKYAPHQIGSFKDVRYLTFTNKFMNDTGFRVGLIESWQPIGTPEQGKLFTYSITVNDDFPLRWPPKPVTDADKDKAKPPDMPQPTKAAINPDEAKQPNLNKRMDQAALGKQEPGAAYQIYSAWTKP